jgi:hypothetical protein
MTMVSYENRHHQALGEIHVLNVPVTIAQLLGLMAALIVIGEPLRLLLSKISRLFNGFDFVEKCVFNVFLGGLILYAIALLPLGLLNTWAIFGLVLVFGLASLGYHWTTQRKPQASSINNWWQRRTTRDQALVFGLFLVALIVQVIPLASLVYGSVHDVSFHSLVVQVITEKGYIPNNLQPYLPEGVIYPQAAHVLFAFAADLVGWSAPQAVSYVTPLFNALTVLGVYFLARRLWANRSFYLGAVFIFTFVAAWPTFITWGANPFVAGFALYLVCLGLFFKLFFESSKNKGKELLAIGILFGYLGALIITFLQSLMMIAVILLIVQYFRKGQNTRNLLKQFVIIFAVSLIPLTPFLYRFAAYYPYPGHNIGLPPDFTAYPQVQQAILQGVQWALENFSPYPALRVGIAVMIFFSVALFFKLGKSSLSRRAFGAALIILTSSVSLSFAAYLLPPEMNVISWGHQGIILVMSVYFLIATFNNNLFAFFSRITEDLAQKTRVAFLATILVGAAVYVPFVYARLALDPSALRDAYGMFAVASGDDNSLMQWIKENLTSNAVILVNQYDGGSFVSSAAQRKTVFPTPGSRLSQGYQEVTDLIHNVTLNATSYAIMKKLNVTHVYVGSGASYAWVEDYKWRPQLFLGNPNFQLVKRIDNAYLFEVLYKNESTVLREDFEHEVWNENGWDVWFFGKGQGNATTANTTDTQKSLRITSQCIDDSMSWRYGYLVSRSVFVLNDSDVTFSFYLNATEGFNGKDTFAAIISSVYHNQTLIFTTPNGVFQDYARAELLNASNGFFTFDLTNLWRQDYNVSLPNEFILEFMNYDSDGIKNVAFVDNVTVTSTPVT